MPETPEPQRHVGPFARAAAQTPAPVLVLVSIVSIQLGTAVAVHLFETLGPIGTTFLRYVAWLRVVARRLVIADRAHISRVAAALLEHGALDADAFLAIVAPPRETPVIRKTPTPPPTSASSPPATGRFSRSWQTQLCKLTVRRVEANPET